VFFETVLLAKQKQMSWPEVFFLGGFRPHLLQNVNVTSVFDDRISLGPFPVLKRPHGPHRGTGRIRCLCALAASGQVTSKGSFWPASAMVTLIRQHGRFLIGFTMVYQIGALANMTYSLVI
jgi:hypothetical protein